jgi:pantoate--beta-alanine ligase
MHIEHSLAGLRALLAGKEAIGFAPTMGNLHEGHLALVEQARERVGADGVVVASIFVNRLQFGAGEDFDRYPRSFERDAQLLREAGCDLLFAPHETEMYPEPQRFQVMPDPALADVLEGAVRSGHFTGMCTVVMKLFTMVRPTLAVFGKKDYQQLLLIRAMVRQFALPLEIVAAETVRTEDGLAMSSRNGYLSPAERAEAPHLARVLRKLADALRAGRRDGSISLAGLQALEAAASAELTGRGWQPDYLSVRRQHDLGLPTEAELADAEPLVALGAARIGSPRLLDNLEIEP